MTAGREGSVATVHHWTGLEARALRLALRMSVRTFAAHLGVGVRTISKWEKLLSSTEPRQDTQAILDTALARADAAVHLRFETNLSETGRSGAGFRPAGHHQRAPCVGVRILDRRSRPIRRRLVPAELCLC